MHLSSIPFRSAGTSASLRAPESYIHGALTS